ncbi:MAG: putative 4-hydroxybenzoate polyprenyltransferase [Chloroflexi bacterium]|nr:putative 4-hydroxybenzoate polyprenyltransferase [Chloroflexota bacterium]
MARVRSLTFPYSLAYKMQMFLEAIKFHESIFALPFAYTGMILAAEGLPTWRQFAWITVAMVAARTVGMSANRIIDRQIDARNPRAAMRHIPSGRLKVADMALLALVSLGVFFFAAAQLNRLALILAPVAIAYLVFYPYTKRFTWTANLLLGWALAISPSAAWIGVKGSMSWEPFMLSLAVALWAGSFDILYHTQDREFHLQEGLHSVAKRFGVAAAFWWARVLDALALAVLLALGVLISIAWPYYIGLAVAALLLIYKHSIVSPNDLSRLGMAFFRINAYVSTSVFAATLAALLIE